MDNDNKGKSGLQDLVGKAQDAKKAIETVKKIKTLWPIISAVAPIVGWLFLAIISIVIVMIPIMYISEKTEEIATGLDKFINFITFEGWTDSESLFFKNLQEEYERYDQLNYKQGEFDVPLIAATIHYSVQVDPDSYSYNGSDKNSEFEYSSTNSLVQKSQLRNFYIVANDKLGSAWTLIPAQKKLIGHLIDTKLTMTCVDYTDWDNLTATVSAIINDFALHLKYTGEDTTGDLSKKNVFKMMQLIAAYASQGENYVEKELRSLGYELVNDNFVADLIRVLRQSDFSSTCTTGQIALPVITKFINYEYYKDYLRGMELSLFGIETAGYLGTQPFATCDNCEYQAASADRKKILKERWITEIFEQRDAYMYLQGTPSNNQRIKYIPGMSTLPIQVGAGQNWRDHMTRGYELGTAECYKDGELVGHNCDHLGVDLGYPEGTPVLSVANGYVIEAQFNAGGYGYYVKIGHDIDGDGKYDYYTLYAHMSKLTVDPLSKIGGGQKIGEVGSTGNSTGNHLHFEIRDADYKAMDPAPILDGLATGGASPLNPLSGSMTCNMFSSSELSSRNSTLAQRVQQEGLGTRAGVVAAATYLSDDLGVIIPYWYGGKYRQKGISSEWGCGKEINAYDGGTDLQPNGSVHPYGMDCSGFVAWAIVNGGYKSSTVPYGSDAQGDLTGNKADWDAAGLKYAKPGDLAWNDHHIGMIIAIDANKGEYYVAEEKGAQYGLVVSKLDATSSNFTHVVLMDNYYNDDDNKEGK